MRPSPQNHVTRASHAPPRENLAGYMLQRMHALGLSQTQLCTDARISRQTLHSMLNAPHKLPALQTVFSLAQVLQVHPLRLLLLLCDQQVQQGQAPLRRMQGDKSAFVRDVTHPDGELVLPGQRFTKVWELQNVGQVPWQNRWLQCMDEDIVVYANNESTLRIAQPLRPDQARLPVPFTRPGDVARLSASFHAPTEAGTVLSYWKMAFEDGTLCFPAAHGVWVKVQVTSLAGSEFDT